MARVSAIPEHLFTYSDTCTERTVQMQSWVRSVLGPALMDYQAGGGVCDPLDVDLAQQVAAAYYTDRDVRTVGQAFLQAGGGGVDLTAPVRVRETDVNAAYQTLLQHEAQVNAGAALAGRMMGTRDNAKLRAIMAELAKHANDPYFTVGFYNNLDESRVVTAMQLGGVQPLVSAYASGRLDKHVTDLVAFMLSMHNTAPGDEDKPYLMYQSRTDALDFLRALKSNPQASRYFAESLSKDQLRKIFYGSLSDSKFRSAFVNVLTAGLSQEPTPDRSRALMHTVSLGLFGDPGRKMSFSEWRKTIGPLGDFYKQGMLNSIDPPTDFSRAGLEAWERDVVGTNTGQDLGLFLYAMNHADEDHELARSMVQGAYVNLMFIGGPEGVAATAAIGALQSVYSSMDPGADWLKKLLPPGRNPDAFQANQQISAAAFTQSLSMLAKRKKLYDSSGRPVTLDGGPGDTVKLQQALDDPDHYTVGDGHDRATVNELLDAFARTEQTEPIKAGGQEYDPPYH